MHVAVLIARLALASVFGLAGVAKLGDRTASASTLEAFGLRPRLASVAGVALPAAELSVAAALLPSASARWAAAAGLILLLIFNAGIANALRHGRTPDCNCFGQVASAPINRGMLVRNAILALVAILVLWRAPGSPLTHWTSNPSVANLVAALMTPIALVVAFVAYSQSTRRKGNLQSPPAVRGAGVLPPGAVAPDFELRSLDGELISLRRLLERGRPTILIFSSPTCLSCLQLLPELSRWNHAIAEDVTLVVIESGMHDWTLPDDQRNALDGLMTLWEPEREVAERYSIVGTPSAISITVDGLISSPPMPGSQRIERLIRRVLATGGTIPGDDELLDTVVAS